MPKIQMDKQTAFQQISLDNSGVGNDPRSVPIVTKVATSMVTISSTSKLQVDTVTGWL